MYVRHRLQRTMPALPRFTVGTSPSASDSGCTTSPSGRDHLSRTGHGITRLQGHLPAVAEPWAVISLGQTAGYEEDQMSCAMGSRGTMCGRWLGNNSSSCEIYGYIATCELFTR